MTVTEPTTMAKLRRKLGRQVGRAVTDFDMIEAGDLVMVCVSGGKDLSLIHI